MGSGAVIYVPSFIKIGSSIQTLLTDARKHTHKQKRDLISLFHFSKIRKVGQLEGSPLNFNGNYTSHSYKRLLVQICLPTDSTLKSLYIPVPRNRLGIWWGRWREPKGQMWDQGLLAFCLQVLCHLSLSCDKLWHKRDHFTGLRPTSGIPNVASALHCMHAQPISPLFTWSANKSWSESSQWTWHMHF
jgi:hypothetical protein